MAYSTLEKQAKKTSYAYNIFLFFLKMKHTNENMKVSPLNTTHTSVGKEKH